MRCSPSPFISELLRAEAEMTFPLVNRRKLHPLKAGNRRAFLRRQSPRCSTSVPGGGVQCPPLGGRCPGVRPQPEFRSVAGAHPLPCRRKLPRETTAPQRGLQGGQPSRQGARKGEGGALFRCQAHDLWGIWKFTTLWGERDKEIQDEALCK